MRDAAERHRQAARTHDMAAMRHDAAATYWTDRGNAGRADIETRSAALQRAGAQLERERARLDEADEDGLERGA